MSLHQDIREQMKEAMKARDALRLNVIRGLLASFTNEAVSKKRKPDEELSDEEVLTVIGRAVKQRKDSIEQFEKGGRTDLAEVEKSELSILETYLPQQMSKDEIVAYVKSKQAELGMTDPAKKNQFMGTIMKELKGKADGTLVKEVIDTVIVS
ncbi:MAG: GatB/YqeY domain-containing protein [bacterium]|nr:GatB/YqeY domain-containing protein [bacterium]